MKIQPTGYWTFFCNPAKWEIDEFLKSNPTTDTYTISSYHKDYFKAGQWGIIRVGVDKRSKNQLNGKPRLLSGIYAIVKILESAKLQTNKNNKNWVDQDEGQKIRYRVKIEYLKSLLNNPILLNTLDLSESEYDKYLVEGQMASTMPLNPKTFNKILTVLEDYESININGVIDEEQTDYYEGKQILTLATRYERNPLARKVCLNYYGHSCYVCNFNFSETYGEIGRDFIHVHHLKEISQIGKEYKVDPIKDLRPVCPNCHAMLHTKKPALTIDELKKQLNKTN